MKSSKFQWQLPEQPELSHEFLELLNIHQLSPLLGKILWQRGVRSEPDFERFFSEDLANLHDPFLIYEMDKAVERIQQAVLEGQRILVYGDYDADGITSTTLMKETLELLGADVEYYLPNRFIEGYGPNKEKYQEKINEGIQLIITVDNGVAGHEAITLAQGQGVDVIVTDHHELPAELPEAYAIIHPRHPKGNYPFGGLAGVGVAFKVATALLEEAPLELLDLVAIGTIADLVSLTDENRLLVKAGLKMIKQTERIGLLALLETSGISLDALTETSIGFALGPRLNAIGRLGDPNPAVELMSTFDEEAAASLASYLNQQNDERKQIVEKITSEALAMLQTDDQFYLLAKEGWHEGVLGIVAGNIMQQTGKPALLLALREDGTAKGSGRSPEQLNLFKMLDSMRDLLLYFGGHHAAVGLTVNQENLVELQNKIDQYIAEQQIDFSSDPPLMVDEVLTPSEVTIELVKSLNQLAPYGTDNPLPNFLFEKVQPTNLKVIGNQHQHLKFSIGEKEPFETIAFNFGQLADEFQQVVDTVGQLTINEWNGRKKPQLLLKDFQVDGIQFFDWRAKRFWQQTINRENTLFLAFQKESQKILPIELQTLVTHYQSLEQIVRYCQENGVQQIAVLDIPDHLEILKELISKNNFTRIYFYGFSPDEAYLNGLGSREQYSRLFKLIHRQARLDIRYKLDGLVQYLSIPKSLLIFMIKVFSELGFVTIEDGVLKKAEIKQNHPLTDSTLYQKRMQQIKNEEFLLLADSEKIKTWLLH